MMLTSKEKTIPLRKQGKNKEEAALYGSRSYCIDNLRV